MLAEMLAEIVLREPANDGRACFLEQLANLCEQRNGCWRARSPLRNKTRNKTRTERARSGNR